MRRAVALIFLWLCLWLGLALGAAGAHPLDEELPPDADQIVLPAVIPVLDFVRYNRVDHRILLWRLDRGDDHRVGALTPQLTEAAAAAGVQSPRAASRLVWEMSETRGLEAREAYLMQEAAKLRADLAALRQDPLATAFDRDTVRIILRFVSLWLADPINGAPQ